MIEYDAEGAEPSQFESAKAGNYHLVIVDVEETRSKNHNDMVVVKVRADEAGYSGVFQHRVTFFPPDHKAAGIALHFLKCIGQPYEGKIKVVPEHWIGKRFFAEVVMEEYPKDSKKFYPKIRYCYPPSDGKLESESIKRANEEVPF